MCWGDPPKFNVRPTKEICQQFSEAIKQSENVDIYQLMSVIWKIYPSGGDRWLIIPLYFFKALVCFIFQTVMLVLMIIQFSKTNSSSNYKDPITKTIACSASLYISVSVITWWMNIEKQSLYQMQYKTFENCPKYVSKVWIYIGLYANMLTLFIALIGSNILIFWAETALDVVLNCVAIFFMVQVDNEIIGETDYENLTKWLDDYRRPVPNNDIQSGNVNGTENDALMEKLNQGYNSMKDKEELIQNIVDRVRKQMEAEENKPYVINCTEVCCDNGNQTQSKCCFCCVKFFYYILMVLHVVTVLCAIVAPIIITILPYKIYD